MSNDKEVIKAYKAFTVLMEASRTAFTNSAFDKSKSLRSKADNIRNTTIEKYGVLAWVDAGKTDV